MREMNQQNRNTRDGLLRAASVAFAVAVCPVAYAGTDDHLFVAPGYTLVPLLGGFDYPTSLVTDGTTMWVAEAGHLPTNPPKVKAVSSDLTVTTILGVTDLPQGTLMGPVNDLAFRDGWLWLSHRQVGANGWAVGAISKFQPSNPVRTFTTVITGLPSSGDHHSNQIVFAADGRGYFSQGSVTNSSVVGADNWIVEGWLELYPTLHDFPPVAITLNGTSFQTVEPFPLDPTATLMTAPYRPFGTGPVAPGTTLPAATPSTPQEGIIAGGGSVYSFDPDAPDVTASLTLEAWGLRNPYGIGFDPADATTLFVSNNGADIRSAMIDGTLKPVGSRSIAEDYDDLFVMTVGGAVEFFGWPDFFHDADTGGVASVTEPIFCAAPAILPIQCPQPVLDTTGLVVEPAFSQVANHPSLTKFDFSESDTFGFMGDVFLAESGSFNPATGAVGEHTGHRVQRIDRNSGEVHEFIANMGSTPEEIFNPAIIVAPLDVVFQGDAMLVVDLGIFQPALMLTGPGTGKIWKVQKVAGSLNDDGKIDGKDLSILLGEWGVRKRGSIADLNGDSAVNTADLNILLSNWSS